MSYEIIENAVSELREKAIVAAEEQAVKIINNVEQKLNEANGVYKAVVSYPKNIYSRDYRYEKAIYSRNSRLVRKAKNHFRDYAVLKNENGEEIGVMDEHNGAKFIDDARTNAGLAYESYVHKLVGKVGEITAAELIGNSAWGYSILRVTKPDGEIEDWKTQMIINTSKYGLPFNQWPTRKMKRK